MILLPLSPACMRGYGSTVVRAEYDEVARKYIPAEKAVNPRPGNTMQAGRKTNVIWSATLGHTALSWMDSRRRVAGA
jgi:hypothetical protein